MATPNIVPRADSEGGLGTASKYWASAYIDLIDAGNINCSTSSTFVIQHTTSNQDIRFKGIDGSSSITALLLDMSAGGAATFSGAVSLTAGALSISGDGSNAATLTESSAGDFTIASVDDLRLSTGGNDIVLQGASSAEFGRLTNSSQDLIIQNTTSDKDIKFKGNDGGVTITPLTLDMSEGGAATFTGSVTSSGDITASGQASPTVRITSNDASTGRAWSLISRFDGDFDISNAGTSSLYFDGPTNSATFAGNVEILGSTFTQTGCVVTNTSATVTHTANTKIKVGMHVSGGGIAPGAFVASLNGTDNNSFQMSKVATSGDGSSGITLTFSDPGQLTLSTANTELTVGDILGRIDFQAPSEASGTDAILVGATIHAEVEETFASDNNSTALVFSTGTTTAPIERMRIDQDGVATFAGKIQTAGEIEGGTLDINGNADIAGNLTITGTTALDVTADVNDNWAGRFENTNSGGFGILAKIAGTSSDEKVFEARVGGNTKMAVTGDGNTTFAGKITTGNQINVLGVHTGSDGGFGEIIFHNNGDSVATIASFRDGTDNSGSLVFQTQNSGTFATALTLAANNNATFAGTVAGTSFNGIPFYSGPEGNSLYTHDVSATNNEGQYNAAYGFLAMDAITTGDANVAVGYKAGGAIAGGSANVAVGFEALQTEDGHGHNTAIGYRALRLQDAGVDAYNTAVGFDAGTAVTSGIKNTLIGGLAGDGINIGNNNVALGHLALSGTGPGNKNTAIGEGALQIASKTFAVNASALDHDGAEGNARRTVTHTADSKIEVGQVVTSASIFAADTKVASITDSTHFIIDRDANSSFTSTTVLTFAGGQDAHNTAVGYQAGNDVTTGTDNTIVGSLAGDALTTGALNVAIGKAALSTEDTGSASVAIGHAALLAQNIDGNAYNTAVGHNAGTAVISGVQNTLIGGLAGDSINTGEGNTALGYKSLENNSTGDYNTAIGYQALMSYSSADGTGHNVAIGVNTGLSVSSGTSNVLIGNLAGDAFTTGVDNVAIGVSSLSAANAGNRSVAIGKQALEAQDAGSEGQNMYNVAVGYQAGASVSTGVNNTIVGSFAGNAIDTGDNNIIIGNDAAASAAGADNETVIGNTATTSALIHGAMENRAYTGAAEGAGIDATNAVSITVGEYNSEIITSIFVDIGNQTGGTVISSSTDNGAIGNATDNNAYITRVTTAVNGVVYKAELICVETPTVSSGSLQADLDLRANASGTIASGTAVSGSPICNSAGAHALGRFVRSADSTTNTITPDHYLYLAQSGTNAGVYNKGKFLIRLYGAKVTGL